MRSLNLEKKRKNTRRSSESGTAKSGSLRKTVKASSGTMKKRKAVSI